MRMHIRSILLAAALAAILAGPQAALAGLEAPRVGTVLRWACDGPYTQAYVVAVTDDANGLVRYEGIADTESYWIEKSSRLTGTSLWNRKVDDQYQWFDEEDFAGFEELVPGSRYKGAVSAQHGSSKWVWDYRLNIAEPRAIEHRVLGRLTLATVVEQRKVYHGDYWSRMTSYVAPELGITVQWIFEDPQGVERCDLVDLKQNVAG